MLLLIIRSSLLLVLSLLNIIDGLHHDFPIAFQLLGGVPQRLAILLDSLVIL